MRKVKKDGSVRKTESKIGKKSKAAPFGARKSSAPSKHRNAEVASKKGVAKRRVGRKAVTGTPLAPVFLVQELDPQSKCGPGTSVQRLFRLREEQENGAVCNHMVFLDRHGWYCEHGRNCPAVPHAKKVR